MSERKVNPFKSCSSKRDAEKFGNDVIPRKVSAMLPPVNKTKDDIMGTETYNWNIEGYDCIACSESGLSFDMTVTLAGAGLNGDKTPGFVNIKELCNDFNILRFMKAIRIRAGDTLIEDISGNELKAMANLFCMIATDWYCANHTSSCFINKENVTYVKVTNKTIVLPVFIPIENLSTIFQIPNDAFPTYKLLNNRLTITIIPETLTPQLLGFNGKIENNTAMQNENQLVETVSFSMPCMKITGVDNLTDKTKKDLFVDKDLRETAIRATKLDFQSFSIVASSGTTQAIPSLSPHDRISVTGLYVMFIDQETGRSVNPSSTKENRCNRTPDNNEDYITGYGFKLNGSKSGMNTINHSEATKLPSSKPFYDACNDAQRNFRLATFSPYHYGESNNINCNEYDRALPYVLAAPLNTLFEDSNEWLNMGTALESGMLSFEFSCLKYDSNDTDAYKSNINSVAPVLIVQSESFIEFTDKGANWSDANRRQVPELK